MGCVLKSVEKLQFWPGFEPQISKDGKKLVEKSVSWYQNNQYGGGWMAPLSVTVVLKYELIVQLQSVKIANGQFYDIQCSSAMC